MRVNEVAKMLGGSIAIYIVMAACSGASGPQGIASGGSASGAGASGSLAASGQTSSGFGVDGSQSGSMTSGESIADAARSGSGGILDALSDPVSTAMADVNQSGTRLKVRRYSGADGSSAFISMHDSQLNTDCGFGLAADGVVRCLPSWPSAGIVGNFADAACSQPIAYTFKGCAAPAYAYQSDTASCAGQPQNHIFPVSGPFGGTVYSGTPSSCVASTTPPPYNFYAVGAEVPPTQFVQGNAETAP